MLLYRGKVDGVKRREYQGRQRAHLQFVMQGEDGELSFLEIRVPDNMVDRFKLGQQVEVPVTYSLVNGEVYFKIDERASADAFKVSASK